MAWDLDSSVWSELLDLAVTSARVVLRDDEPADDAAMQAIERLLRMDRDGAPMPAEIHGYTWVVARNVALDQVRLRARRRELPVDEARGGAPVESEIAAALACSPGGVRMTIHRSRVLLRERLGPEWEAAWAA